MVASKSGSATIPEVLGCDTVPAIGGRDVTSRAERSSLTSVPGWSVWLFRIQVPAGAARASVFLVGT
jgi:hypothetical protein